MQRGARRGAAIVAAALSFAFVGLGPAVLGAAQPAAAVEEDSIEALVNEARASAGAVELTRNAELDAIALEWASEMAAAGAMSHNPDLGELLPEGWTAAAENVAEGRPSAMTLHDAWMASPGHRANILGDFTDVGIAFIFAEGTSWGVQVFASYPATGPSSIDGSTDGVTARLSDAARAARVVEPSPRGFVLVPRAGEAAANDSPAFSSLSAAVLSESMAEDSARVGIRIGFAAIVLAAVSALLPRLMRRLRAQRNR